MSISDKELKMMIEDCESEMSASNCSLDDWTKEKMEDLIRFYQEKGFISQPQREFLKRLWDKI